VQDIAPDLAYVSGWQDKGYLYIARQLKSQGCPTVVGFDDQWHGSFRQIAGSYLMKLFWKKRYFSHAWVAGPYQFEYASRMGFSKSQIIFNLLSCDIDAFSQSAVHQLAQQETPSFLFVGRLHPNKGLDCLIEAFRIYKANRGAWGLTIVGNGSMRKRLEKSENVEVKGFLSAGGLREIISRSGAFVLPSCHEPWGIVVQEFAVAGLPLILSNRVGSRPVFLIDGDNGYTFPFGSAQDLAQRMLQLSRLDGATLMQMGRKSHALGMEITPQKSAASLVSILQNKSPSAV
jgi:glycosyltransferase involved in cell wall biosynthesis